jgi:hypothetical protein
MKSRSKESHSLSSNVTERGTLPSNENVTEGSEPMPTEDQMTVSERRKYLKVMKPRYQKPRYQKASCSEQSALLTEMEQVTGPHRKSLLRLLHAPPWSERRASVSED